MSRKFHILFFSGLFLWLLMCLSFPTWEGHSYHYDTHSASVPLREAGTFGLRKIPPLAPIWAPPPAHSPHIQAKVRWPWQPPSHPWHVEISLPSLVVWLTTGVVLFGIGGRIASSVWPPPAPDPVITINWHTALGLVLGFVAAMVLVVFTMGMAPESYYIATLLLGGVIGFGIGFEAAFRKRPSRRQGASASIPSTREESAGSSNSPAVATPATRGAGWGMLWFTLGFIASLFLLYLAVVTASQFRGPVLRYSTLFTPEYARPQGPINMAAGAGIALMGWLGGLWLVRSQRLTALGAGFITGATIWGLLFASWR